MKIDYQNNGIDFLLSLRGIKDALPVIEQAAENGFFAALNNGISYADALALLSPDSGRAERILALLETAGLVFCGKDYICNTPVSRQYLCGDGFPGEEELIQIAAKRLSVMLGNNVKTVSACGDTLPLANVFAAENNASLTEGPSDICFYGSVPSAERLSDSMILAFAGPFRGDISLYAASELLKNYGKENGYQILDRDGVISFCKRNRLFYTQVISLTGFCSVMFASKKKELLDGILLTPIQRLTAELKKLDIVSVKKMDPSEAVTSSWVRDHCRYGCSSYGEKHCPPRSPSWDETQTRLSDYGKALLIEGQPPTHTFQRLMLRAEAMAFRAGYYRAFAYWAGPCSLCTECNPPAPPKKCTASRPSMESAGIDVFATVRKQGYTLETRKEKGEYIRYFGLLLLE